MRERLADEAGHLLGRLDLQRVMVDHADANFLVPYLASDQLEIHAARAAGLEGDHVRIHLGQGIERRRVARRLGEQALRRRIAPAGVAPHLGFRAQSAYRVVEHLDHEFRVQDGVTQAFGGEQMDLRLLHLDDFAAGVGEFVQFLVQRVADRQDAFAQVPVMQVAHRHGDQLGRDGAELDRLCRLSLRRLPHRRIAQPAAPYRSDQVRHDTRLEDVVQDMAGLMRDTGEPAFDLVGSRAGEAVHVQRRVRKPVMPGHVGIKAAIAVGDDVEAGGLLRIDDRRNRVEILLAEQRVAQGRLKRAPAEARVIP